MNALTTGHRRGSQYIASARRFALPMKLTPLILLLTCAVHAQSPLEPRDSIATHLRVTSANSDTSYCGQSLRQMRAYRPTRIVGIAPNPANYFTVVVLDVGEPGMIHFQWYSAHGIPMRPSHRWLDKGQWAITMECWLLPTGDYQITARHESTGRVAVTDRNRGIVKIRR